jgi:DNA ligase-associated metallophosphoesterase
MTPSRWELAPGIWLDARRALWLAEEKVLAVADTHLGYAWAQRQRGLLLPITVRDDTLERLLALQADYAPRDVVVLGDIVHRAVPIPALEEQVKQLVSTLTRASRLTLVAGNHDKDLDQLLGRFLYSVRFVPELVAGPHLLVHGDRPCDPAPKGGLTVMGHEHPAVSLGDGAGSRIKCPCFLVSEKLLVLPAFSHWAAGTVAGGYGFMSPLAKKARFKQAFAICGDKLLPMKL